MEDIAHLLVFIAMARGWVIAHEELLYAPEYLKNQDIRFNYTDVYNKQKFALTHLLPLEFHPYLSHQCPLHTTLTSLCASLLSSFYYGVS